MDSGNRTQSRGREKEKVGVAAQWCQSSILQHNTIVEICCITTCTHLATVSCVLKHLLGGKVSQDEEGSSGSPQVLFRGG